MTKASTERKLKRGVFERTPFTADECFQITELQRVVNARKFEAAQIKANTALVPRGQEIAAEIDAIARLLDNVKNQQVASLLVHHGYPQGSKCDVNLTTGEVILHAEDANEPTDPAKTA